MHRRALYGFLGTILMLSVSANAQRGTDVAPASLTERGSTPFHLKATIREPGDPSAKTEVEIYWAAPDKWRRTIRSEEFSQTFVVNGESTFEEDSGDYFPFSLQVLARVMVDPAGYPEQSVIFWDKRDFNGKRIARRVIHGRGPGDSVMAEITDLEELRSLSQDLFGFSDPTPLNKRIRSIGLPEKELRSLAVETRDIIWPQVVDGATTGSASYYVSLDRSGQVREVFPVRSANERANESACRQIMRWRFKPVVKDGFPVQAESLLTFTLNTRAFGPASPLNDAEARKLASNVVEPSIPPGTVPSGSTLTLRASVDDEGHLIEVIAGEGASKMFMPCYQALKQWQFKPLMQDGQPGPYRAEIVFRAP